MSETGLKRSPRLTKGALVQIAEGLIIPEPNIIPFQFNPEKMTRTLQPFDPANVRGTDDKNAAPGVQPFDPEESISMKIQLDASDQLEDGDRVAKDTGVAERIAALEKLLFPSKGLLGDLVGSVGSLLGSPPPERKTVPIVLFIWGIGRVVPVRVTSYSIEEQFFLPSLYPIRAEVDLSMDVLTPDVFIKQEGIVEELAVGAYKFFRVQQDLLALAHTARNIDAVRGLLPF